MNAAGLSVAGTVTAASAWAGAADGAASTERDGSSPWAMANAVPSAAQAAIITMPRGSLILPHLSRQPSVSWESPDAATNRTCPDRTLSGQVCSDCCRIRLLLTHTPE